MAGVIFLVRQYVADIRAMCVLNASIGVISINQTSCIRTIHAYYILAGFIYLETPVLQQVAGCTITLGLQDPEFLKPLRPMYRSITVS